MIPSLGAYYRPDRLEEALALLAAEPGCDVLAGGTDLLLEHSARRGLVDVMRLGLDGIEVRSEGLVLGAAVRIQELLEAPIAAAWADGALVGAGLEFGTLQVRNAATVGGNIAHALPAADLVPVLLALDAEVELARADGRGGIARRRLPLDGFATAPFRTVLERGEIITQVRVPAATRTWRAQYRKVGRVLKDLAQVNCSVALALGDGTIREARIVLGAVHPTVVRVRDAERELQGAIPGTADWEARVQRAMEAVRAFVRPITDVRASAEWRRHVSGVLVRRCLQFCTDPQSTGRAPRLEDGPSYCIGLGAGAVT